MTGAFVGGEWDDKDWFRSSRWSEEVVAEFERRLARARPHNRLQYLVIQAGHLCSQPDPTLRANGRELLRRAIDGEGEFHDLHAKTARENLADNLAAEGMLDAAVDAYRDTLRAIASSPNGRSGTSGGTELSFAEALLRRRGPHDLSEAQQLLDSIDRASTPAISLFRHVTTRYLMARSELHRALGETEVADEYAQLALEGLEAPAFPVRPTTPAPPSELPPAAALAAVVEAIAPTLKAAGFRKRRHAFNRRTPDGLTHVLSLQAGASDPPREGASNSLLPSLHGKFTVNLSVHIPGMRHSVAAGAWVNEYNGHLRRRLGTLADEQARDVWWDSRHPDAAADVAEVIRSVGLPWLGRFPDVGSVIEAWRIEGWRAIGMSPASSVDIACLLIRLDRRDEAEVVLREYLSGALNQSHVRYLRDFLPTIGMGHLGLPGD